ncbi:MAG: hypothetical protein ACTSWC_13010 [Promethearchaeota archaeon]
MLSSIADLAKQIFKDDLQSVIIGKYHIYRLTRSLANKDHALDQFLNRYSLYDIRKFNVQHFQEFEKRLSKIFGDLVYDPLDRFQSVF